jgi:hypothetical protein
LHVLIHLSLKPFCTFFYNFYFVFCRKCNYLFITLSAETATLKSEHIMSFFCPPFSFTLSPLHFSFFLPLFSHSSCGCPLKSPPPIYICVLSPWSLPPLLCYPFHLRPSTPSPHHHIVFMQPPVANDVFPLSSRCVWPGAMSATHL